MATYILPEQYPSISEELHYFEEESYGLISELTDMVLSVTSDEVELKEIPYSLDPVVNAMFDCQEAIGQDYVVKFYVVIRGMGLYSSNVKLDRLVASGVRLTDLQIVSSVKDFISKLDQSGRSGEGWSMVTTANVECDGYIDKHP